MVTEKEAKGKRNITLQSKVSKRSSILSLFSTLLFFYFSIASLVKLLFYYLFCIIFQCKISRPIKPV